MTPGAPKSGTLAAATHPPAISQQTCSGLGSKDQLRGGITQMGLARGMRVFDAPRVTVQSPQPLAVRVNPGDPFPSLWQRHGLLFFFHMEMELRKTSKQDGGPREGLGVSYFHSIFSLLEDHAEREYPFPVAQASAAGAHKERGRGMFSGSRALLWTCVLSPQTLPGGSLQVCAARTAAARQGGQGRLETRRRAWCVGCGAAGSTPELIRFLIPLPCRSNSLLGLI